ncbi:hypothetical protein ACGFNP_25695 [Nonomuraea sp. NPDC049269]|uniref:hypothetical protein n=1 Tax=Nonomuraea sp. NPDC049269 TaxID=3364349 RepID=UPI003715A1A4
MSEYPAEAWERLSRSLRSRRARVDSRYKNRTTFCAETGLHYKLVQDIEGAPDTRTNFTDESFALVEAAYRLADGSIRRSLAGGALEPAPDGESAQRAGRPATYEPIDDEPDSPITADLVKLLQAANDRLAELADKFDEQGRKLDDQGRKLDDQARRIEEMQRDQQENGSRRKGA